MLAVTPEGRPVTSKETVGVGSLPGTTLIVKVVLSPARKDAELAGVVPAQTTHIYRRRG